LDGESGALRGHRNAKLLLNKHQGGGAKSIRWFVGVGWLSSAGLLFLIVLDAITAGGKSDRR